MVTRVVAKQAKTTKVKNNFTNNGNKSSKEYSVAFLVEGEKYNLGEKSSGEKFKFALGLHLCWRFRCELGQHTA